MSKTNLSLGMLLTAALIYGCGSDSKGDSSSNGGGSGGTIASGGSSGSSTGGGGSNTGGSSGEQATGGSSGQGGAVGVAPVDDHCVRRAIKHADGLCYCQPSTLTMCSDACTDPQTDPDHCGDCDTQCDATQPCNSGLCGMAPTAVVPAATGCGSMHLALATDGTIYWTDQMHGTVKSLAAGGTTPATVADTQMAPTSIEVNGTSIYWLNSGNNTIMKATAGTPGAQTLVTVATTVNGFTVSDDGSTLYFSTQTIVNMVSTTPGGTATEVGHEDTGIPSALSVAGNVIGFPANNNNDVDVMTMVPGTPAVCASEDSTTATNLNCTRIARSQAGINYNLFKIIGDNAYWGNQSNVLTSSVSQPTGVNATIASGNIDAMQLTGFSINGDTIYFADDKGFVYNSPLVVNSQAVQIARGQLGITSLVANGTNVYWANGDCAIMTLPTN